MDILKQLFKDCNVDEFKKTFDAIQNPKDEFLEEFVISVRQIPLNTISNKDDKRLKCFHDMLYHIASKYPHMITNVVLYLLDLMYLSEYKYLYYSLIDTEDKPMDKCCVICFADKGYLLRNVCSSGCSYCCHFECLKKHNFKCLWCKRDIPTCEKRFGFSGQLDTRIYMPLFNIFPRQLLDVNTYKMSFDKDEIAMNSLIFLQTFRFEKILTEMNDSEFCDFIAKLHQEQFLIEESPLKLIDNFPSNLPRNTNKNAYLELEKILNDRCKLIK